MNESSISRPMNPKLEANADQVLSRIARAEHLYRHELIIREVPTQLHDGLVRYLVHRIRPGHFLNAVIASDLREAIGRADPDCQRGLASIVLFLAQVAPANSWGSYEALESWLDKEDERNPDAHLGAVVEADTHGGER